MGMTAQIENNSLAVTGLTVDETDARLDHISNNVNPETPYILTIPSNRPVEFYQEHQRQFWVKGTLFPYEEGQLQYISNFSDWGQGLIRPVGGWDNGKGGIATQNTTPQSAPMTPSQPTKKIKLGDYARKKAVGDVQSMNSQASPLTDSIDAAAYKGRESQKERQKQLGSTISTVSKKRTIDVVERPLRPISPTSPPMQSHEALLPAEDLPPPMTPLPPRLAAVVAEYREYQKESANSAARPLGRPNLAARSYKRYRRRLEHLAQKNVVTGRERLVIVLRFRKLKTQYKNLTRECMHLSEQSPQYGRALSSDSIMRLKTLGDDLMKEAKSMEENQTSLFLHLEAILCSVTFSILDKRGKADAREQWEIMMRLLSEFTDRYIVRNNLLHPEGPEVEKVGLSEELDLIQYLVDSLMCHIHRELSRCHLPAANSAPSSYGDISTWLKAEALAYAIKASNTLGPKRLASRYPKVWEDSSDVYIQESKGGQDWMSLILTGSFSFPLAGGSMLESIRGARRLLMKCRHEMGIDVADHLGAFAAKSDATA